MAVVTITATGAGTWTAPVGVTTIIVECWGGGGAGGQRSTNASGAGGGGGGSYARVNAMAVTGGVVYNYTVGLGGTDGVTPVNGGTTTFTGNAGAFCAAPGAVSVTANSQTATAGATAINGDNVRGGGAGAAGTGSLSGGGGESGSPDFAGFSAGGAVGGTGRVDGGDGGPGRTTSADGGPGVQPGGGGGGGYRTTGTTRNGGAGGAGQLRITFTAYVFPAAGGTYGVTGTLLHFKHDVPVVAGSYSLAVSDVTLTKGGITGAFALGLDPIAYTLTGAAALGKAVMIPLPDSYVITGTAEPLIWNHPILATTAAYSVTGTLIGTLVSAPVASTSYSLTGQDVIFLVPASPSHPMAALGSTYSVTGAIAGTNVNFSGGNYLLTGTDLFFNLGTVTPGPRIDALPAQYIYDWQFPVTLASTVPGDPGVYTVTGAIVTLRHGWSVAAVSGVYTVTGQDQILRRTFPMPAAAGVYAVTDSGVVEFIFNGVVTVIMPAVGDTYTTVGATDVVLRYARKVFCDEGDYPLTVFDVTFGLLQNQAVVLPMDPGVYDLTGSIAGTIYTPTNAFSLAGGAGSGVYTITGSDAVPKRTVLPMAAVGGSYAVTGTAATLPSPPRKMVADSGGYIINGATLNGRRRPKPGGGFDYIMGVGGKDSIIPQRRRRR